MSGSWRNMAKVWRGVLLLAVGAVLALAPAMTLYAADDSWSSLTPSGCAQCHGENVAAEHHQSDSYSQGLCTQCHEGVTTGGDCASCHTFVPQQNAHHNQVNDCAQCHSNVGDLTACLGCHQGKIRTPHHLAAQDNPNDPGNIIDCASCHTTLQPLTGCVGCHSDGLRERHHTVAASSCQDCHAELAPVSSCTSCHSESSWGSGLDAMGAHHASAVSGDRSCESCHSGAPRPFNCHDCHQGEAADRHHYIASQAQIQCAICHDAIAVNITATTGCQECHAPNEANRTRHHDLAMADPNLSCAACHSDAGTVPGCASCHDGNYWGLDASGQPVDARDRHHALAETAGSDCAACHTSMVFDSSCGSCHERGASRPTHHQYTSIACAFCHGPEAVVTSCGDCHNATSWAAGTAMAQHHDVVRTAQSIDCSVCHVTLVPTETCASCHGAASWSAGSAEGQHHQVVRIEQALACAACHEGGLPGEDNNCQACHNDGEARTFHHELAATDCQSCHADLPVVASCESCHSEQDWLVDARTDHHAKLDAGVACATCHANVAAQGDCFACHDSGFWAEGSARDQHHNVAAAGSSCSDCHTAMTAAAGCESCHAATSWTVDPRTDHHVIATADSVACVLCHTAIAPTTACVDCHQGESAQTHHLTVRGSYPEYSSCSSCHTGMVESDSCASCHTADSWGSDESAGQRHHTLAEATSLSCDACHTAFVPTTGCRSCHGDQWPEGAYNLHHEPETKETYGFGCMGCHTFDMETGLGMPTEAACEACHTTIVTPGADIGQIHHAAPSTLANQCGACHQGVDSISLDCATCHADQAKDGGPDMHHVMPGASDCASCHAGLDPTLLDCVACHQGKDRDGGVAMHHDRTEYAENLCSTCHGGVTVNLDCASCHAGQALDGGVAMHHAHPAYAADDCATCHDGAAEAGSNCALCHLAVGAVPIDELHHATASGSQCASCHAGIEAAELDCATCHARQPALVDGSTAMHHGTQDYFADNCSRCHSGAIALDCAGCHIAPENPAVKPMPQRHHESDFAQVNSCGSCHTGAEAASASCEQCHVGGNNPTIVQRHHATASYTAETCSACHVGIDGVSGDALDCATCHAGRGKDGSPAMHHATSAYATDNCSGCHAGKTFEQLLAGNECLTCHTGPNPGLIAARHHATTPATSNQCAACHTVDQAELACAACHASQPVLNGGALMHHGSAAAAAGTCTDCHATVDTGNLGCEACHATQPVLNGSLQMHHTTDWFVDGRCTSCHIGADSGLMNCAACHVDPNAPPMAERHHNSTFAQTALCTDCHRTVDTAELDCTLCHARQPLVLNGSTEMHHEITLSGMTKQCAACHVGATLADNSCAICHLADGQPSIADTHHATEIYNIGLCSECHVGAEAAGIGCAPCHGGDANHHLQQAYTDGNCTTNCHTTITLNGGNCAECHTGAGQPPIAEIHHGAPLTELNGNCASCHQAVSSPDSCSSCHKSSPHHDTFQSQSGNCTACHKVPAWAGDRPKQASCRECHGTNKHDKGGPIQDYGTCAGCHTNSPFHAKPTSIPGYTGYGAGKKKFNMFWSLYAQKEGAGKKLRPNGEDMDDEGGFKIKAVQLDFTTVQISHGGQTYTVPSFDPTDSVSLTDCTRCHGDLREMVSCGNELWTAHVSKGYVSLALAQLAESTYIGSYCQTTPPPPTNLALNKKATASKYESSSYHPAFAIDGDAISRWYVRSTSSHWLKVDLGQTHKINKVVINWHTQYAREYNVEVSKDNSNWTRVREERSGTGGTDTVTFTARDARYVRIDCKKVRSDGVGYSIYELEVYK